MCPDSNFRKGLMCTGTNSSLVKTSSLSLFLCKLLLTLNQKREKKFLLLQKCPAATVYRTISAVSQKRVSDANQRNTESTQQGKACL